MKIYFYLLIFFNELAINGTLSQPNKLTPLFFPFANLAIMATQASGFIHWWHSWPLVPKAFMAGTSHSWHPGGRNPPMAVHIWHTLAASPCDASKHWTSCTWCSGPSGGAKGWSWPSWASPSWPSWQWQASWWSSLAAWSSWPSWAPWSWHSSWSQSWPLLPAWHRVFLATLGLGSVWPQMAAAQQIFVHEIAIKWLLQKTWACQEGSKHKHELAKMAIHRKKHMDLPRWLKTQT